MDLLGLLVSLFVGSPELEIPPNTSIPAVIEPLESPQNSDKTSSSEAIAVEVALDTPKAIIEPVIVDKEDLCFCVRYLKLLGAELPPGNAEDFTPNGTPDIGNVALFRYKTDAHVALITGYTENGFAVKESNFRSCQTTEREVYWSDPYLKGFIKG